MEELKNLIKDGESDTLEFKENFTREVAITAGAFANTKGGTILIGVTDGGKIKGVQQSNDALKDRVNRISQVTEPMVIPEIDVEEMDGKKVIVIGIKEFPIKPVAVRGRCYRRVGNSNRVMQPHEIASMHLESTGMSWDKLPARGASLDDIDFEKVERYVRRANASGRRKIEGWETSVPVLEKLKLVRDGRPSWAAVLLFSKDPQGFLSQAVIHCGRFKEEVMVIDDRMIGGTIIDQIEEAMDFVRKNINVEFVMTGRPEREEVWDYPLNAVREAIINAVCHRDYTIPSNVEVRIYDDRLIVWSPGGLPSGITLADLLKLHSSKLRNKGIGGVFYDIKLIEQWGGGIEKMVKFCREAGLPDPVFEEKQGFRVIFRKDVYTVEYLHSLGLNERQVKAVMYVKEKGRITNGVYQELTGVSRQTATIDLNELVASNVFGRIGKVGKGVAYQMTKLTNK
jgi:ATP-dependent DNA helicase RecG